MTPEQIALLRDFGIVPGMLIVALVSVVRYFREELRRERTEADAREAATVARYETRIAAAEAREQKWQQHCLALLSVADKAAGTIDNLAGLEKR